MRGGKPKGMPPNATGRSMVQVNPAAVIIAADQSTTLYHPPIADRMAQNRPHCLALNKLIPKFNSHRSINQITSYISQLLFAKRPHCAPLKAPLSGAP